ncbi:acyltransferase family protein [Rhodovulum sp. YEN HP10]|uniref:acyltransferase family protein n=1 Tax=Rhodovulum sp. HP10 TaxID=3387397 RepID=UPI0039DFB8DA
MSLRYRPEIDGLRTVAVLSVLIYHAEFSLSGHPVLKGGFLWVDVFFVISGFLITSLILTEWDRTGRFSILNFYERRARRILPALLTVMFASIPAAWAILYPRQMIDFVWSLAASLGFISNYFWYDLLASYAAAADALHPFLHTWSLAVEEQFYIFFPLLVAAVLARSGRLLLPILAALAAGGLVLAEILTRLDWSLSFYGLQSRVWELATGALTAFVMRHAPDRGSRPQRDAWLAGAGLALILLPMAALPVNWHHPGIGTLPAVLGTALVLRHAGGGDPVTRLLASPPFVAIGLISYSLYLWHQPIFAFARHLELDPPAWQKLCWIGLAMALARASYLWVETPFRDRRRTRLRPLVASLSGSTFLVLAFVGALLATDGLKARLPGLIALYGKNEFDNEALRDRSWTVLDALAAASGEAGSEASSPSPFEARRLWFAQGTPGPRVLILGDSHAKDLFNALALNPDLFAGIGLARFGMHARLPQGQIETLFAAPNLAAADIVLLSFRYSDRHLDRLSQLIERLKAADKTVVLATSSAEYELIDGMPVFDWYLRSSRAAFDPEALGRLAWSRRASHIAAINDRIAAIGRAEGVAVIDKIAPICDAAPQSCAAITDDGYKTFFDYGHFTLEGAAYLGRRLHALGDLPF